MTQSEWLTATDPNVMLRFLRGKASDRKLRLFACACVRLLGPSLSDERCRRAVDAAERYADGLASEGELVVARDAVRFAGRAIARGAPIWPDRDLHRELVVCVHDASRDATQAKAEVAAQQGTRNATHAAGKRAWLAVGEAVMGEKTWQAGREACGAMYKAQARVLRDIFGPFPFGYLPPLAPPLLAWQDGLVMKLAQAAYDDRLLPFGHLDPQRLAVLCDALLDAGCPADDELLLHLRAEGPHWRGCHALDALLGRS